MNVLLTCAGRRNYLVAYFKKALGGKGKVYVADMSRDAPAMIEAGKDVFTVPPVTDPGYFDALLRQCQKRKIGLLLSLNDFELPGLARQFERFKDGGVMAVVSAPDVVDLCFDKWRTHERLTALDVPVPATFLGLASARAALASGKLRFPLIVKPRWGTASLCVERAADETELASACEWVGRKLARTAVGRVGDVPADERIVVQQELRGQEYGVDIINDLEGAHQAVIVKKKLSMRAGETDRAVTVDEPALASLARRVGESLGHRGLMDCDAFITPEGPAILELNPRFGGGYPFSHAAGADVPAALLAWARGKKAQGRWLKAKAGVTAAKCDRLVSAGKRR